MSLDPMEKRMDKFEEKFDKLVEKFDNFALLITTTYTPQTRLDKEIEKIEESLKGKASKDTEENQKRMWKSIIGAVIMAGLALIIVT